MNMVKVKTAELEGAQLDCAVAKAAGHNAIFFDGQVLLPNSSGDMVRPFSPSVNWLQGGPIIERELITLVCLDDGRWMSGKCSGTPTSPLIAAMRAFVASKLGDEVEVPV